VTPETVGGEHHVTAHVSFGGDWRSTFDLQGLLLGIDFRQWLGNFEVNVVQTKQKLPWFRA
jgi:hypothetical protein